MVGCPCVRCSLPAPVKIMSRTPGDHVAQTLGLYCVPSAFSSLKRFELKIDLSLECGAQVLSRPRFLSTGSALGAPGPQVCTFILFIVCTFRKRLLTPTQSRSCTLRLTILSFSLWFCNAFKTYSKTQTKIKLYPQRGILCTRSRL